MKRLGDYIRLVDVRNRDLAVTRLVGLTIDKDFIPSVANVIGTDLSKYKVIQQEQFACSLMQVSRDGKMPIAMFKGEDAIMSPAYPLFEVIDKSTLLPQYLMMWFARKEFDREASFYAIGGVRGNLTWEDFCDFKLPVPSIDHQRQIVVEYETLSRRISVNKQLIDKFEETAQTLYRKMFVDDIDKEHLPKGWRLGTLGDITDVKSGFSFKSSMWRNSGVPVIKISSISNKSIRIEDCDYTDIDTINENKPLCARYGDLLIAMSGATIGKFAINFNKQNLFVNQRVGKFSLGENPIVNAPFLYCTLSTKTIQNEIHSIGGNSAQENISPDGILKIEIPFSYTTIKRFNVIMQPLFNSISIYWNQNECLQKSKELLLAMM